MKRLVWLVLLPGLLVPVTGGGQEKAGGVELTVVKYDGLAAAVQKNRGKVVLVDFWGEFCPPCKKGFPHVVQLHKQFAKDGLAVISVSLDDLADNPDETRGRVLTFLKKQGADFTNLLLDENSKVWQEKLRFDGPPCYYLFNRQGKWTRFSSDSKSDVDYQAMDRLVEELLKEK